MACALGLAWAPACAGRAPGAQAPTAPLELQLRASDGQTFELANLRGAPLLVFFFTTFDTPSQLAITPLVQVLSKHQELRALGIAVQPNPQQLLPLYREALALQFPLAFDPEERIVAGRTEFGPIETVPAFVLLDAEGRITARHVGAMNEAELEKFVAAAAR